MPIRNYFATMLLFWAIELLAALAMILWVGRLWKMGKESALVKFVCHRYHLWFALLLLFLPLIARHLYLFQILHRPPTPVAGSAINYQMVVGVLLDLLYGAIYGLAGCLFAQSGKNVAGFRPWLAFGLSAAIIFFSQAIYWVPGFSPRGFGGYLPAVLAVVVFLTFVISRAFPGKPVQTSVAGASEPNSKSPALALSLAFLPSVMFLGALTFFRSSQLEAGPLIVAFIVSVVCCFSSSIMLFRRNTGRAILAGVLFMLLNAVVSFLFGCGVVLSNMKF